MAMSKEARILTLLLIDTAFFFLEIIVGYAVGSLALVADSFHMLNDVMSLIVALYAVKLSSKSSNSKDPRYSYGWQRAEILGALINGVFLLALCFSIFMEALERFINISPVNNPKLVIIVGSLGLASNLLGLILFHDHGHSHGGHSHGGHSHGHSHDAQPVVQPAPVTTIRSPDDSTTAVDPSITSSEGRGREDSVTSLLGHPAQTRAFVVHTAHSLGYESVPASSSEEASRLVSSSVSGGANYGATTEVHSHDHDIEAANGSTAAKAKGGLLGRSKAHAEEDEHDHGHEGHDHSHGGGHSHGSEGSMNMRGVFLHVLGDALGNVGVIVSGLIILLCEGTWRFYTDPAISFLITIIIFTSALPLVKSASFILLQGVPTTIPLETVKESLLAVAGVLSVHDLHIWQLSESKIVASVHVLVDCDDLESQRYMSIAAELRRLLHGWGIHSATIQPEFVKGGLGEAARRSGVALHPDGTDDQGRLITEDGALVEDELSRNGAACLLTCGPDSGEACAAASCCPPDQSGKNSPNAATTPRATSPAAPGHRH